MLYQQKSKNGLHVRGDVDYRSVTEKFCPGCNQLKVISEFANNRNKYDGKASYCKSCNRKYENIYKSKDTVKAQIRSRALKYPTQTMRDLGMSRDQYNTVWAEQCGKCAICGQEETGKHQSGATKRLAVDHDHKTGLFRGLLCAECNKKLGLLERDMDFVLAAQAYLERFDSTSL